MGCRDEDAVGNSFPVHLFLLECPPTNFFHLLSHSLRQPGIPKDADPFDSPGHADLTAHFGLGYRCLTVLAWVKLNIIQAAIFFITCIPDDTIFFCS
jgi:hypothetical protein